MSAARAQPPSGIEELVRRHMRAAYAVALAVVGCPQDAEDIVHDSLLIALQRLRECNPRRFSGWLMRIVRNRALNAFNFDVRRALLRERFAGDAMPALSANENPGARTAVLAALEGLSEREREVVLLHDLAGWTHAEIAFALNLSAVNCRQKLFRARRTLRARLDDAC